MVSRSSRAMQPGGDKALNFWRVTDWQGREARSFLGLDLNFYGEITSRSLLFRCIINKSQDLTNFEPNWFKMNYS
ncbi:hypothetical protein AXF42_Ash019439 [Apostasia shenzhenica]|uniref:Uncharacterized protein n=1 Tax=Apostasia shenzhenica TaxID=1088818 RepID=A0A2I0AYE5_9ASPA|nr:hypothetical protein AXF42_Ash019439 [Apostasia shenzhenica]